MKLSIQLIVCPESWNRRQTPRCWAARRAPIPPRLPAHRTRKCPRTTPSQAPSKWRRERGTLSPSAMPTICAPPTVCASPIFCVSLKGPALHPCRERLDCVMRRIVSPPRRGPRFPLSPLPRFRRQGRVPETVSSDCLGSGMYRKKPWMQSPASPTRVRIVKAASSSPAMAVARDARIAAVMSMARAGGEDSRFSPVMLPMATRYVEARMLPTSIRAEQASSSNVCVVPSG